MCSVVSTRDRANEQEWERVNNRMASKWRQTIQAVWAAGKRKKATKIKIAQELQMSAKKQMYNDTVVVGSLILNRVSFGLLIIFFELFCILRTRVCVCSAYADAFVDQCGCWLWLAMWSNRLPRTVRYVSIWFLLKCIFCNPPWMCQ